MCLRSCKYSLSLSLLAFSLTACVTPNEETPPDPEMLGDLNTGGAEEDSADVNKGSYPKDFVAAGSSLYMSADSGDGHQLFVYLPSDGNCLRVIGLRGDTNVRLLEPTPLAAVGERLFFYAKTGQNGKRQLWRAHLRKAWPVMSLNDEFISDVDIFAEMGAYLLFFRKSGKEWQAKTVHAKTGAVADLPFRHSKEPVILGSGSDFVAFKTKGGLGNHMYVCDHKVVNEIPFDKLHHFEDSFVRYRGTMIFSGEDDHGAEPWGFVYKNRNRYWR